MLRILFFVFVILKVQFYYFALADQTPIIVIAPSKVNQSYSSVGTSVTSISGEEIRETGKFF